MNTQDPKHLENLRQQYEATPYPRVPLETSPQGDYARLFFHNFVTPYYLRNQQVISTEGAVILDAGCGSGWNALVLAVANPGATIVGIDISEESINLARYRLQHHGFENAEFHVLAIADISQLGLQFDYINCDEVLYLLPDPIAGLKSLQLVLKPDGIIRTNLHSALQRSHYFRAQRFFKIMGLMEGNPGDAEMAIVTETMQALNDQVDLKAVTWNSKFEHPETQWTILMNHLLLGDKGYMIPDLFAALRATNLDFISMLAWRQWDIVDLFKDASKLPKIWELALPELPMETRLHLFELLQPTHRLLDFWCGHYGAIEGQKPVPAWEMTEWLTAQIHLHPQLQARAIQTDLRNRLQQQQPFEISRYLQSVVSEPILLDTLSATCLLPLWDDPQPFTALVDRWMQHGPLDPITSEPISREGAISKVKHVLTQLEACLYVLVEIP
jgi:2-polyprenyl-3-methyl-5-hydroxy-6-metoxy-1,4-benzoquinol methylase